MGASLRSLIPGALILLAWPAGGWASAWVASVKLHPAAFLAALAMYGTWAGAAAGWAVRPLVARASGGQSPMPFTANRVRGGAAAAACLAAGLAAFRLHDDVRERWNDARSNQVRSQIGSRIANHHEAQEFLQVLQEDVSNSFGYLGGDHGRARRRWTQDPRYREARAELAGFRTASRRSDAYLRGVVDRAGFDLPSGLSLLIARAIPFFAGFGAAAIAWRVGLPPSNAAEAK